MLPAGNVAKSSEAAAFGRRDLSGTDYVYLWVDGIHLKVRLEQDKLCLLVMLGVLLVAATPLALSVFALLDAARRPAWAWSLAERPQAMWMGMILVGTFLSILGIGLSLYYLTRVRPAVAAAENGKISSPRSVTPRVDP